MSELPTAPDARVPTHTDPDRGFLSKLLGDIGLLRPRQAPIGSATHRTGSVLIVEVWAPERAVAVLGAAMPDAAQSVLLGPFLLREQTLAWSVELRAHGGYRDAPRPAEVPTCPADYPVAPAYQAFLAFWQRVSVGRARLTSWPIAFSAPDAAGQRAVHLRDLFGANYVFRDEVIHFESTWKNLLDHLATGDAADDEWTIDVDGTELVDFDFDFFD